MSDPAATAQVRAYTRADRDAVLELQARVFGAEAATSVANWTWEYDENPFQVAGVPLGWIAEIDGRMAGYYGMLPLRLCVDGRFVLALCGADFCVDETWRGRGLGTLLTRYLLQAARGHRLFATSATPTAAHLLKKAGLSFVDVTTEPSLWACGDFSAGVAGAGGTETADLDDPALGAALDAFAHELARHHRVVLWRGADYFAWRYGAYPIASAKPVVRVLRAGSAVRGVAVLQCDRAAGRAFLLELLHRPDDRDACTSLLRDALALAGPSRAHELYAFHRVPTARAVLAAHGFVSVSQGAIVPLLDLPVTTSDGGPSLADWYVAPGDGDFLLRVGSGAPR
ncbi:MAG: GNAT family N-acetyltransferase [Planctomycetota bacterium]